MSSAEKFIKFTGVRGMIARNMMGSLHNAAQLTYTTDIDARAMLAAREHFKTGDIAVGYEDMILKSVSHALQKHPEHNGTVDEKGALLSKEINLGFAVATPGGLMVPVIMATQRKSLVQISADRRALTAKAQTGKLAIKDMKEGTFTVSNLGQTRVDHFTPILNGGQIALLGVGRIRRPSDGKGAAQMGLSLTADHRVVDGWASGLFLTEIAEWLEALSAEKETI